MTAGNAGKISQRFFPGNVSIRRYKVLCVSFGSTFNETVFHYPGRHIARAASSEDHSRALRASTDRLPVDWRRPRGRLRQSWLRTIDSDLKPLNLGLHSALRRATDRPSWRRIVETAMLFERATR